MPQAVTIENQEPQGFADRLIKEREVLRLLSICRPTLFNKVRSGALPQPVRIGRALRWRMSDIENFIRAGTRADTER
jgi:predicted DNA-binding transcriptional regulator AlpA